MKRQIGDLEPQRRSKEVTTLPSLSFSSSSYLYRGTQRVDNEEKMEEEEEEEEEK